MRSLSAGLGCVVVLASSCSDSSSSDVVRPQIVSNAHDISLCCNPNQEFPAKVGEFEIQIYEGQLTYLDIDTVTVTFTSLLESADVDDSSGYRSRSPVHLSVASGDQIPVGSTTVEVYVDSCYFTRIDVTFLAEIVGRRVDDQRLSVTGIRQQFAVVNTCPPREDPPTPPELIVETILGEPVDGFDQYGVEMPTGVPTNNLSSQVPPQVPTLDFTETFEVGSMVVDLSEQQIEDAFTGDTPAFPLGISDNGLTVEAEFPLPMMPGNYLIAWQGVVGDIPLELEGQFLQMAFAFDRDNDSQNNHFAEEPFDLDPFDDTDTWCSGQYDEFLGWTFAVLDSQQFPPYSLDSGARMILYDQVQMFVVPVDELGSPTEMPARYTTFAHEGDYGMSEGPWSGDASPRIDEPRLTVVVDPGS